MLSDPQHEYRNSSSGFWYYYSKQNKESSYLPKTGDEVLFEYEIKNLKDSVVYTREELGRIEYLVDKEELITGLQDGLKLMKEGEVVTFLFPSHKAFGYTGSDRIAPNEPLIYTVELIKINKLSENENN